MSENIELIANCLSYMCNIINQVIKKRYDYNGRDIDMMFIYENYKGEIENIYRKVRE